MKIKGGFMEALILKGKKILKLGYPEGKVIGIIIRAVMKNYSVTERSLVIKKLKDVLKNPVKYHEDKIFREVVLTLTVKNGKTEASGMRAPEIELEVCGCPIN
jgi:tRNA-splicing ligase RtcB (3'-phosphate/5'-hydroxy nucleic acid ligase)